jgi:hypothetical protein
VKLHGNAQNQNGLHQNVRLSRLPKQEVAATTKPCARQVSLDRPKNVWRMSIEISTMIHYKMQCITSWNDQRIRRNTSLHLPEMPLFAEAVEFFRSQLSKD